MATEQKLEISVSDEFMDFPMDLPTDIGYESLDSIKRVRLEDFMLFDELEINLCDGINVIHGENSTGKSALLKMIYSTIKMIGMTGAVTRDIAKTKLENGIAEKLKGVFRPDNHEIGRLVKKESTNNYSGVTIELGSKKSVFFNIGKQATEHISLVKYPFERITNEVIYIPPKEIISASENFESLYRDYHIAFEETYVDLIQQLDKPVKKEISDKALQAALNTLHDLIGGEVVQEGKKFYVKMKDGNSIEMGLLSEGYRKIATLIRLIKNGSIRKGTIILWDEPETNMNPKMIKPLVDALIAIQKIGVCFIIASHDYFVQQEIQMNAAASGINTQFIALYNENDRICVESKEKAYMLDHNPIMEEFDAMYEREQELINSGKYN